jgi:DivIVA domain-containing protein
MGSALVYVIVVGLVAAAVYLLVAFVFGRSEELAPMPPGATPTRLPARDLTGGDVRDLRFQQTLRGYKCSEVDWALERLAAEVDALRARVDTMESAQESGQESGQETGGEGGEPADAGPRTNGHPPDVADPAPTDPTVGGVRADPTAEARRS